MKPLGDVNKPPEHMEIVRRNNLPDMMAFRARRKGRWPKYFYLNGELYRKMSINRPMDLISVWRVSDATFLTFPYSETKKRIRPAFYTPEVCALINRHRVTIMDKIHEGAFPRPQRAWPITMPIDQRDQTNTTARLLWSEEDIMKAHDFFSKQTRGPARRIPVVSVEAKNMPNKRELVSLIKNQQITYVKSKEGEFVPLWKAPDF